MAFDSSHQLADVQFTVPPAAVALYNDRPLPINMGIGSVQKHDSLSTVYFFLRDETFGQRVFGFARVSAIGTQPHGYLSAANDSHAIAWQRHLLDLNASTDVDALSETVESVLEVLSAHGPTAIDLTNLSDKGVQGEHLAAILRTTSAWDSQTPGWYQALHVAKLALQREGIDPQDALYGLI
jgi:hypothetical protein